MARPRIFLSHSSSRCTPESGCHCRRYLDAMESHVRAGGCDPVVDRSVLIGGDEWNEKILKEVKSAHGLIILISPHALTSFYVMQEVITATAERVAGDDRYGIMPVLLPGVRRADLKGSGLEKLNLGRFDMVDWPASAGPEKPPAEIVSALLPLVERLGGVPHPEVTDFVACRMRDVSDVALEKTASILGVGTLAYATDHSRHRVAQGLLTERPVPHPGERCALRTAFKNFLPHVKEAACRADIVDTVVPFARVPKDDAEELRRVALEGGNRVALLRSTLGETPDMYVRRASESPEPWVVHRPIPGMGVSGFADGLVAEIRELLLHEIAYDMPCDDRTLDRLLARHEEESGPFTIVLHHPPDARLIETLLTEFPRLLFLFAHEQAGADAATGAHLRLEGMTPGQEQDMVRTHREFRSRR
ncbi:toll/interleukin-1 receptor domain-containing protein [Streptomyces sp. NPDC087219]|uniref:toll/interleukin-1 receptor domain-containing protein n=1 Tax=Streptomyces sp. NPDC087219 TaxID=3365770 RepID=UPI00382ED73C